MKKVEMQISRKHALWLRQKQERARKRDVVKRMLSRQYKWLRKYGRSPLAAREIVTRTMSRDQLDMMGDALESMFAPRSYVYRYGRA